MSGVRGAGIYLAERLSRFMRRATTILLSPEERVVLTRWVRGAAVGDLRATRARIVLAAAAGMENIEVARAVGVDRLTVARWRGRFLVSRLRGVAQGTIPAPRPAKVSEETVRAIVRRTVGSAASPQGPWTTRSLAHRYGVSHTTVHRIWDSYRVRPTRRPELPIRADPAAALLPSEVAGVFLHPPDFAVATILTPGTPPEARSVPPAVDSGPVEGPRSPGSIDSHHLAQLLNELDTPQPNPPVERRRGRDFLRFLAGIHRQTGALLNVRVIATHPGRSGVSGVDRWLVRHPHFRIQLSPDFAEWKRQALLDVDAVGRGTPPIERRGGKLASSRSLAQSLTTYSVAGAPFEWVATHGEVRRGKAAPRLMYELASTGHPSLVADGRDPLPGPAGEREVARARAMARVVLRKCLKVRSGERVLIQSWTTTQGYANGLVLESLRLGALPLVLHEDEATFWTAALESPPKHLTRLGEHGRAAVERSDVLVSFFGPSDRARLHAFPPNLRYRLGEYHDDLYRAAARTGCRAVQMAIGRASPASARFYGVDLPSWVHELVEGTLVDPQKFRQRAKRLTIALLRGREIHITHPNGTDLRLGLKGRKPHLADGVVASGRTGRNWEMTTLPAGVLSVALDEGVAQGSFCANVASSAAVSDEVDDYVEGKWRFESGRLVRFGFTRGARAFEESYRGAGRGRDKPASLSFGLNDRISLSPLLEDQGLGTITMHIGRNDHLGGATRASWWAWLFLRGADLTIDGERILRGGKYQE